MSAGIRFVDDVAVTERARQARRERWRSPWRVVVPGALALVYTLSAFWLWCTKAPLGGVVADPGALCFLLGLSSCGVVIGVAARTSVIRGLRGVEVVIVCFAGLWLFAIAALVGLLVVVGIPE